MRASKGLGPERANPRFLERIEELRFTKRNYRALSFSFSVRCNSRVTMQQVEGILGPFAAPAGPQLEDLLPNPLTPPVYTLATRGNGRGPAFTLFYDQIMIVDGVDREAALLQLFSHINQETLYRTGDFVLLHSGAVATEAGEGVILPASSGSGKSTLVLGLVMAGYRYLSDEAAAIDPVTRRLFPFPKAVSLKDGSIELFRSLRGRSSSLKGELYVPAEQIRREVQGFPCPVRYVIFPAYERDAQTELVPMSAAEATLEVMRNALNLHFYKARALTALADVVRNASCFRLTSGDLGAAVRAVQRVTGAPSTKGKARSAARYVGVLRSVGGRA